LPEGSRITFNIIDAVTTTSADMVAAHVDDDDDDDNGSGHIRACLLMNLPRLLWCSCGVFDTYIA
jgi:hypothetical protein